MKKNMVLVLLVFSVVCVSFFSCGGNAGGENTTLSIPGSRYKTVIPAGQGRPETTQILEFKTDGTFVLSVSSAENPSTEAVRGTYVVKGDEISIIITFFLEDDPNDSMIGKTFKLNILEGGKKIKMDERTVYDRM